MVTFEFFGVKIRLDFSFFAAVGIFLAFDRAGYGAYCLAACFCHEISHLAVMLIEGQPPDEMLFSGGGICIKQKNDVSFAVLAAGCTVNFLLFIVYCLVLPRDNIFKLMFGGANLATGLFNLLPIGSLDGKRMLEKLCYKRLSYAAAQKFLNIAGGLGYAFALGGICLLGLSGALNLTAITVMIYVFLMDYLVG